MKFSILIPAYKSQYLHECIESILNQTFTDFEVIIVNDASPENIDSIIESFSDPRIRYFVNKTNCGAINVVDNWNISLSYAHGDYVICMGDDDKLLPSCLEEYTKLIERYPNLKVYHTWTEIIDENSKVTSMQEARPEREGVYSMMWSRWSGRIQFIGDFLFERKELLSNKGFYKMPLAWGSDDISTYIAAKYNGIANMQKPGFQYRVNSQTITNTGNTIIKLEAIKEEEEWYKCFLIDEPVNVDLPERIFWKMLKERLPKMLAKKRVYTISSGIMEHSITKAFQIWKVRKRLKLSTIIITYAIMEAIKQRIMIRMNR